MAINQSIRKAVEEALKELDETALMFENPSFDNSIIGLTTDCRVVYDYQKMVEEYCQDENVEALEAMEFIDYNTIRTLPYYDKSPVIVDNELLNVFMEGEWEKNTKTFH